MGKLSFGTTGLSYEVNRVDFNKRADGAPKCPRCDQRVYFNEEKKSNGKSWHTRCHTCFICKKSLDSTSTNGHEGEIYCTSCHRREFGTKGYGFAGGASGLSTETSSLDILYGRRRSRSSTGSSSSSSGLLSPKSPNLPINVNGLNTFSSAASSEHSSSSHSSTYSSASASNTSVIGNNRPAIANHRSVIGNNRPAIANNRSVIANNRSATINNPSAIADNPSATTKTLAIQIDKASPDCCPRCGKRVYMAEEVKALKRKWHKQCFKCAMCQKMLNVGSCDGHQGEVFCKSCYSRSFGPKGYGYGGGAGTLSTDPHRFYKSTRPKSTNNSFSQNNGLREEFLRTDLNGSTREWIEHQETEQYVQHIAAELDQFEQTFH